MYGAGLYEMGRLSECVLCNIVGLRAGHTAESYSNLGNAMKQIGELELSKRLYLRAIELKPRFSEAYANLGLLLAEKGEVGEAVEAYASSLLLGGSRDAVWCQLGQLYRADGRLCDARRCLGEAARRGSYVAVSTLAAMAKDEGDNECACIYYREAIRRRPELADAHSNLGNVLKQHGRLDEAIACYEHAMRHAPELAVARGNLASAYLERGDLELAIRTFHEAINLEPRFADAYNNLGNALRQAGRLEEAISSYRAALALRPDHAHAHNNLGNAMKDAGNVKEAVRCYQIATKIAPRLAAAHSNLGLVLKERGDLNGAIARYRAALAVDSSFADAYSNLGNALKDAGRLDQAFHCYSVAIMLRPDFADAYSNLASAYKDAGRNSEAITCYRRALQLKPDFADAFANLTHTLVFVCDWTNRDRDFEELSQIVAKQLDEDQHEGQGGYGAVAGTIATKVCRVPSIQPFHTLVYPVDISDMLKIARRYAMRAEQNASQVEGLPASRPLYNKLLPAQANRLLSASVGRLPPRESPIATMQSNAARRLRVGYVSSDLGNHPLAHLMQSIFGMHDKAKYEVVCYSLSPDDGSAWRRKIAREVEHFVDVSGLCLRDLALRVLADQMDILINLNGYTKGARNELFALRCAPVQVSYMGFCGTLGADYVQYLVADSIVVPREHEPFYAEKIVRMPHCYFVNDHAQSARYVFEPSALPRRTEYGVPDPCAFVFCNFNQIYKIDPTIFEVWCNILKRVERSVLWLLRFPPIGEANIRHEARKRGVPDHRIHFTQVSPKDEHIKRGTLADLFLDTPQCNAHTTGCDILWGGCPMLTLLGNKMATRVAASLLYAVHCPDLVTTSLEAYEELAVRLATDVRLYRKVKASVQRARPYAPLWDTRRWVSNFENAIDQMWHHRDQPTHITVLDHGSFRHIADNDSPVAAARGEGPDQTAQRHEQSHHISTLIDQCGVQERRSEPSFNLAAAVQVPMLFPPNACPQQDSQLRAPTHILHLANIVPTPLAPTPLHHFLNAPGIISQRSYPSPPLHIPMGATEATFSNIYQLD